MDRYSDEVRKSLFRAKNTVLQVIEEQVGVGRKRDGRLDQVYFLLVDVLHDDQNNITPPYATYAPNEDET